MEPNANPIEVLRWYVDAGVDEAVLDVPRDRYGETSVPEVAFQVPVPSSVPGLAERAAVSPPIPPASPISTPVSVPAPTPARLRDAPTPPSQEAAVRSAVALASEADSLDALHSALESFEGCGLKKTATHLVFGDGNADARIMFVGAAPGREEDRQGVPFVGESGQLFDRMLASIGLDRTNTYLAHTVFWRPPGNRTPTPSEVAVCQPFIERMVELVDPEVIVTVGGPATHALLGKKGAVSKLRGNWFSYATPRLARPAEAMAIFHPEYLLSTPAHKREAWQDLQAIAEKLDALKSAHQT